MAMAGNAAGVNLDGIDNVAECRTHAVEQAIRAEGCAKMLRAAHKLVEELVHDLEVRLHKICETIRKETNDQVESERQRYATEKNENAPIDTASGVTNGLFAFSATIINQYIERPQVLGPGAPPSPELGSMSPAHGVTIPERENPLEHGKRPLTMSDDDSDEEMPQSRIRRGRKRRLVDESSSNVEQRFVLLH